MTDALTALRWRPTLHDVALREVSATPDLGPDDLAGHGRPWWQPAPVGRGPAAGT